MRWSISEAKGSVRTGEKILAIIRVKHGKTLLVQGVLLRRWEKVNAFRGQSLETVCDRYEQAVKIFDSVVKRRARCGHS